MGDFASSSRTLDQALAECPTYNRAREVTTDSSSSEGVNVEKIACYGHRGALSFSLVRLSLRATATAAPLS